MKGIQGLVNRLHDHKENGTEKNRQAVGIQRKWILLSFVKLRFLLGEPLSSASHRLTFDLWLAKDNRFLNPKSSYERILTAPPCRLIKIVDAVWDGRL